MPAHVIAHECDWFTVIACLLACLPASLPACFVVGRTVCLLTCLLACLPACFLAFLLFARFTVFPFASLCGCMLSCLPACHHAGMFACLLGCLAACVIARLPLSVQPCLPSTPLVSLSSPPLTSLQSLTFGVLLSSFRPCFCPSNLPSFCGASHAVCDSCRMWNVQYHMPQIAGGCGGMHVAHYRFSLFASSDWSYTPIGCCCRPPHHMCGAVLCIVCKTCKRMQKASHTNTSPQHTGTGA